MYKYIEGNYIHKQSHKVKKFDAYLLLLYEAKHGGSKLGLKHDFIVGVRTFSVNSFQLETNMPHFLHILLLVTKWLYLFGLKWPCLAVQDKSCSPVNKEKIFNAPIEQCLKLSILHCRSWIYLYHIEEDSPLWTGLL